MFDAPPPDVDPNNLKVMALIAKNLRADSLWIDYYQRCTKEYTGLLASMSETEKKQRAYAINPKVPATESDKQGNLKIKIDGGLPF